MEKPGRILLFIRLSIRRQTIQRSLHPAKVSRTWCTRITLNFSFSDLFSVASCRHNRLSVAVGVDLINNVPEDPHVDENIFSNIGESQDLQYIEIGFACVNGQNVPDNSFCCS